MIKVSDYIFKRLKEYGVKHVFMVTGGGAMHLDDSLSCAKGMSYICNHHEQACSIGAEGYSRVSGKFGVVLVTSGPGGTNTLTGVIGQWLDSVPVLYISGQVKFETTTASCPDVGLRQLGDQEINIVDIVRPVTKYATMVLNPLEIKKHLEKAIYLATHGRPGPVWLDIPLNVQAAMIEENTLVGYDPKEDEIKFDEKDIDSKINQIIDLLKKSKRPVFLAGNGIRIAGAEEIFLEAARNFKMPVLSTFNGIDLINSDHPLYIGRIGTVGSRAGNFALQNSDLLFSVGSRNNIRQISYNWKSYARAAKKIIVDIDKAELNKPTIKSDIAVWADAKYFLEKLRGRIGREKLPNWNWWLNWCLERKKRYPPVLAENKSDKDGVDLYYFNKILTELLKPGAVAVAGNGSACVGLFQAGIVKKNQRFFWNSGCASMGYDLPAAIGACFANNKQDVVCLAGDGSLQMNIQELQTVVYHKLPLKIFYLNNQGYTSIKQTQDSFFNGRRIGCSPQTGVSFPDIVKIGHAYGIRTAIISNHKNLKEKIKNILKTKGSIIVEVRLKSEYKFLPKLSSEKKSDGRIVSKPLEDLYPFLNREEFKKNMIIPEWEE